MSWSLVGDPWYQIAYKKKKLVERKQSFFCKKKKKTLAHQGHHIFFLTNTTKFPSKLLHCSRTHVLYQNVDSIVFISGSIQDLGFEF